MTDIAEAPTRLDLPTPKQGQWLLRGIHVPTIIMGHPAFEQQIELFDGADMACIPIDGRVLRASLKVWNHSPTGFAWGYPGSGPAQLALATLMQLNLELAKAHYQRFKFAALCQTPWQEDLYVIFEPERFFAGDNEACTAFPCGRIHPQREGR